MKTYNFGDQCLYKEILGGKTANCMRYNGTKVILSVDHLACLVIADNNVMIFEIIFNGHK